MVIFFGIGGIENGDFLCVFNALCGFTNALFFTTSAYVEEYWLWLSHASTSTQSNATADKRYLLGKWMQRTTDKGYSCKYAKIPCSEPVLTDSFCNIIQGTQNLGNEGVKKEEEGCPVTVSGRKSSAYIYEPNQPIDEQFGLHL
ncbi:hypothetical protein C5167_015797 [Papaver somniferum]|uniref:Uncharacterized protein n=1 Tax=Papaver somniferum TaxID=3469 RepID=A0A4Y7JAH3_PAPSO|nr:hypothetical protein C5167_015797 [Papaver somniferum]